MSVVALSQLNKNDQKRLKNILKEISDKFHEELQIKNTENLPDEKIELLKNIGSQVALAMYDGRGDIIEKIVYAKNNEQKRLRSVDEMKQLRLGFAQRFDMDAFDSYDNPSAEKLFYARLMLTNKYEDIMNYNNLSLKEFKAVCECLTNEVSKEEIDNRIKTNTLLKDDTEVKGLDVLVDEFGSMGNDEDIELDENFEDFLAL